MNSDLQQLANQIAHETQNLSCDQLMWHPKGKWSIAEILEHLSLTYSGTKLLFDRCLEAGMPSARPRSAKDRVRAFVVTRLGYLPSGREAPAGTKPKGSDCERVRHDFTNKIAQMDDSIAECERRFGRRTAILDHPILGPFTANEWRRFHCVHGRHHLRQIRYLCKSVEGVRQQQF